MTKSSADKPCETCQKVKALWPKAQRKNILCDECHQRKKRNKKESK